MPLSLENPGSPPLNNYISCCSVQLCSQRGVLFFGRVLSGSKCGVFFPPLPEKPRIWTCCSMTTATRGPCYHSQFSLTVESGRRRCTLEHASEEQPHRIDLKGKILLLHLIEEVRGQSGHESGAAELCWVRFKGLSTRLKHSLRKPRQQDTTELDLPPEAFLTDDSCCCTYGCLWVDLARLPSSAESRLTVSPP